MRMIQKGKWCKIDGDLYLLTDFELFQITKELRLTYNHRLQPCLVGRPRDPELFLASDYQRPVQLCGQCDNLTHARELIVRYIKKHSARVINSYVRSMGYPAEAGTKGSVR